ncbi:hypothetical protein [Bdellovibrio bacteriovorus]|uniref:hypothetical protein n=1 Tax=Bdellovibrio bacteriovorus TaxID=959 RepID=UPI0035A5944C
MNLKGLLAFFIFFGLHEVHAATDYGFEIGGRQQAGDVIGLNFSANSQWGFQGGFFANIATEQGPAHFRTGIFYTQRPLQSHNDVTGNEIDFDLDYLDIPIALLIRPSEKFGVYMGFITSINLSKSCSGDPACQVLDVDTPNFPVLFGFLYKATPKWGLNFYIDGGNGYVARGLADYKAVGLNLSFALE